MNSFDYIIIGAGSAGCVIANRLSENPNNTVLLLEAGGPDKDPLLNIPGAYGDLHKRKVNYGFYTEPQEFVNGRRLSVPRGKVLGGSSSTNAMAYVRGNWKDYDAWPWSNEEILRLFKKSENNEQAEELENGQHGTEGPLSVGFTTSYKSGFLDAYLEAGQNLGYPLNKNYNGTKQYGVGRFQFTIKNGKRQSTATTFLKPVMTRKNLTVVTNAQVSKILIENKKAIGVQYGNNTVKANKEVILSAGAIHSPQILMLSGIGEKETLEKHGIEVKADLKGVGKNLQDHLFHFVSCVATKNEGLNHELKPLNKIKGLFNYVVNKTGPFMIGPLEAFAFINTDQTKKEVNLQFHFTPFHIGDGKTSNVYDTSTYPTYDGFSILPSLLKPKSRGYVSISSADPTDPPIIQPNFLSEKEDLDILVAGTRIAFEFLENKAFNGLIKEVLVINKDSTDQEIIEHIKSSVETIYHPVSTCKMGTDDMSVVNDKLQVYSIENLRVADASIFPEIISGNTNATCLMIGEKAAELILNG